MVPKTTSPSSPVALLHIFVSSPSHLLPSVSAGPPCSTRKSLEKENEKDSMVHFIWILITPWIKLAGVMKKIYKTVSSFCMLDFSIKKIDGFIMLAHCVHVWIYCTVCQNFTLCDIFRETSLAIDGSLN